MAPTDDELRRRLVDRLRQAGTIVSRPVADAMLAVPRHRFVPDLDLTTAYIDRALLVKESARGVVLSTISQPTIVAEMLEGLRVEPGHHVLEVGTGSGYDAALLSVLVGAAGAVTTVEVEADLAEAAIARLAVLGYRVHVVVGDGRTGYSPDAPYDRVIVTAGARSVSEAWADQLREGGRLVVPLVDPHGVGSVVAFDKEAGELQPEVGTACAFLPLRDPGG